MSACHAPSLAAGALGPAAGVPTRRYQRRRPERTVLYRLVQQHLSTWIAEQREADPDAEPIAAWIERELRQYLTCGILAHGFARALSGLWS